MSNSNPEITEINRIKQELADSKTQIRKLEKQLANQSPSRVPAAVTVNNALEQIGMFVETNDQMILVYPWDNEWLDEYWVPDLLHNMKNRA
jgi:hypothetical protein